MKQMVFLFYLFAFLAFDVQSQDVTRYKFSVTSLESDKICGKKLYLVNKEGPFADAYIHDGMATFCLDVNTQIDDVYLVLKQFDSQFYRIRLTYFDDCGCSIDLPTMTVKLLEKEIANDQIATIPITSIPEDGFISEEEFESRYGHDSLFFPTKSLVGYDTAYSNMLSGTITVDRFYSQYGYYPKQATIDSLKETAVINLAKLKARWLSYQLIQLNEPILCEGYHKDIFRYEWSNNGANTLTYNPYSIRIEHDDSGSATMFCSYVLFNPCEDHQTFCDVIPINGDDFSHLVSLVAQLDFWRKESVLGNGGYNSILEANIDGHYHVIFRGEGEDPALDELQRFLWSLTGLGENKIVHRRIRIE